MLIERPRKAETITTTYNITLFNGFYKRFYTKIPIITSLNIQKKGNNQPIPKKTDFLDKETLSLAALYKLFKNSVKYLEVSTNNLSDIKTKKGGFLHFHWKNQQISWNL